MKRLDPQKIQVKYVDDVKPGTLVLPRRYTLTHSDTSGELYLTIGNKYDSKQISNLYTRLMRDEVLAEIIKQGESYLFLIYCHVSGGFILGTAGWRYLIFKKELPLVLEAIRYADRTLFEKEPELDNAMVEIVFNSTSSKYNKAENWDKMLNYR